MTVNQAIRILSAAAAEAERHRQMALSIHDRDKNLKFISIRMGLTDAIDVIKSHRAAGRTTFDKKLLQFGGMR